MSEVDIYDPTIIEPVELKEDLDMNKLQDFVINLGRKYSLELNSFNFSLSKTQLYFFSYPTFRNKIREFQHWSTYKIHLMVNIKYFKIVYDTLLKNFNEFGVDFTDEKPLLYFKIMNGNHYMIENTVSWNIIPFNYYDKIDQTNPNKEFINTRIDPTLKYTKDGKEYNYEFMLNPIFVFYVCNSKESNIDETKNLISLLMKLFPENKDMELPNHYPRFNFKLNSLLYFSVGDSTEKIHQLCGSSGLNPDGTYNCTSTGMKGLMRPSFNYTIPNEYEEIKTKCTISNENECNKNNNFSKKFSNHELCKWSTNKCIENPIYSPNLLALDDNNSLANIYHEIGYPEIYEKFKSEILQEQVDKKYLKYKTKYLELKKKLSKIY